MIALDEAFLKAQSPLILQADLGPYRTVLLVCEFLRLRSDTLEEVTSLPEPDGEAASNQGASDKPMSPAPAPACDPNGSCANEDGPYHVDNNSPEFQETRLEGSEERIQDVVWVLKLYEKLRDGASLRERVALVNNMADAKELPTPILQALAQACSTTEPANRDQLDIRFFFMAQQRDSKMKLRLVNKTLCFTIQEDEQGDIKDFVKNTVLLPGQHELEMRRYSRESSRQLEAHKEARRALDPDRLSRLESRLKGIEDKIGGMLEKAKERPAKRAKLFAIDKLGHRLDEAATGCEGDEGVDATVSSSKCSQNFENHDRAQQLTKDITAVIR